MSSMWVYLILLGLGILVSSLTTAAQKALSEVDRHDVNKLAEHGSLAARTAARFLTQSKIWVLASTLLKYACLILVGAAAALMMRGQSPFWLILPLLLSWLLVSVLHVWTRVLVGRNPLLATLRLSPLVSIPIWLVWPLAVLLRELAVRSGGEIDKTEETIFLSDDGVRVTISGESDESDIEDSQKEMITGILEMQDTVAREVMVPRIDVEAIDADAPLAEALDVIISAGHSRIPVYEDNIDHIIGLLYAKDLLKCFQQEAKNTPIRSLLRPAYFVPFSKDVKTLLGEMRKRRVHIAIVVDEYGGTAGLVTIEDILEEIVGEIQDEYDSGEALMVQSTGAGVYLLNGRLDIYSLAKLIDVDLEDEDADTVAGLIYAELGHVPSPGESVTLHGWKFTVVSVEGRRIDQVRAELQRAPSDASVNEPETEMRPSPQSQQTLNFEPPIA